MKQQRSGAQDAAKGIMIISVVFFHCLMMTYTNHGESIQSFNILMALFPFLLSAFFFYTGYNYVSNDRSYKENIARRAKQLLIPMAFAFVISTLLISSMELAFHHDNPMGTLRDLGNSVLYSLMSEPLALMIGFPKEGGIVFEVILALGLLWFLYALFICSLFFFWLVKYTNKRLSTLVSVVLLLLVLAFCLGQFVGNYLPYTVQCYPVILAIMLTAAYLRKSNFLDKEIVTKKDFVLRGINALIAEGLIVGTCLVCYFLFGATTVGSLPGGMFDAKIKGFDAFVSFGFGLLGTYFIHTLCRLIARIPVLGKCLQWVGNHSALFYLFHPIFLELAAIAIFQKQILLGRTQAFVYLPVVLGFLVLTCLLIDFIIKSRKKKREQKALVDGETPKEE